MEKVLNVKGQEITIHDVGKIFNEKREGDFECIVRAGFTILKFCIDSHEVEPLLKWANMENACEERLVIYNDIKFVVIKRSDIDSIEIVG